jgi:phosphatidylethanolamine-binding protein (PEBP) family uncharacterized protein
MDTWPARSGRSKRALVPAEKLRDDVRMQIERKGFYLLSLQLQLSVPTTRSPRYTCDGAGISPALSWSGAPQDAALALIVDDPDAPRGVFTHWVLYDVPIDMHELPEGVPATERIAGGAAQGRNGWHTLGYGGPCPRRATGRIATASRSTPWTRRWAWTQAPRRSGCST